jgi:hypothetical protein
VTYARLSLWICNRNRNLQHAIADGQSNFQAAPSTTRTSLPLESVTYGFWIEPKVICAPDCALTPDGVSTYSTGSGNTGSVVTKCMVATGVCFGWNRWKEAVQFARGVIE